MRRAVVLKALGVLTLVAVASCGGAKPAPAPAVNNTAQDSCKPLYVVGDSAEATRSFELEADEICRRFGVTPVLRHPPLLAVELDGFVAESGEQVDLAIIPPRHLNVFIEKELIQPVDDWIDPTDPWFTDILPVYRNLYMRFGDHFYGYVYDGDSHLLFYRKDLFDQLGLRFPETWTEYDQVARALAQSEQSRYGTAIIAREGKAYMSFATRYASLGGEYFDSKMHPLIAGPLGVQVLTEMAALHKDVSPEALYDWADLNKALFAGTIPMAVQFTDTARFSYDTKVWGSTVAGKLAWGAVPGQEKGAPRGGIWFGRILTVSKQSKQPEVAAQVAAYITSPEVSGKMITRADTINDPYRFSHLAHPENQTLFPDQATAQNLFAAMTKSLERPMADLTIPGGWSYTLALDNAVLKVLRGEATPEAALQAAAEEWETITDNYGRESQSVAFKQWVTWVREGNMQ